MIQRSGFSLELPTDLRARHAHLLNVFLVLGSGIVKNWAHEAALAADHRDLISVPYRGCLSNGIRRKTLFQARRRVLFDIVSDKKTAIKRQVNR